MKEIQPPVSTPRPAASQCQVMNNMPPHPDVCMLPHKSTLNETVVM
jgi:hypothetical protein